MLFVIEHFCFRVLESALSRGLHGGMVALFAVICSNVPNYSFDFWVLSSNMSWIWTSLKRNVGFKSSEYEISSYSENKLGALLDDYGGLKPESVVRLAGSFSLNFPDSIEYSTGSFPLDTTLL